MKSIPPLPLRLAVTLAVVVAAVLVVAYQFRAYLQNPWTPDGQVRATVVEVASRVSGPITNLPISDNQAVTAGELLFQIDPRTFQATVNQSKASVEEAKDKADRARLTYQTDTGAESKQLLTQLENAEALAAAALSQARANLSAAQLDLEFTRVLAPVNGYVTHLNVDLGTQTVADRPLMALVNRDSFWFSAFFRETLMENVRPGDKAMIRLMAYPDKPIEGHVESVGWGIATVDGRPGYDLLPQVRPNFEWIRLAQRIPVRVELGDIPAGVDLRFGITASVLVMSDDSNTSRYGVYTRGSPAGTLGS